MFTFFHIDFDFTFSFKKRNVIDSAKPIFNLHNNTVSLFPGQGTKSLRLAHKHTGSLVGWPGLCSSDTGTMAHCTATLPARILIIHLKTYKWKENSSKLHCILIAQVVYISCSQFPACHHIEDTSTFIMSVRKSELRDNLALTL